MITSPQTSTNPSKGTDACDHKPPNVHQPEQGNAGPTIIDMWLSAAEGDASGLWSGSFIGDLFFSKLFVWGQYAAFGTTAPETRSASAKPETPTGAGVR